MVKIILRDMYAYIEGTYPFVPIHEATSFYAKNYQYTPKYLSGIWDGKLRLFEKIKKRFPIGLAQDVIVSLKMNDFAVDVIDQRKIPPHSLDLSKTTLAGISFDYPYDFQLACATEMVTQKNGILNLATNCVHGSTRVTIKRGSRSSSTVYYYTMNELFEKFHKPLSPSKHQYIKKRKSPFYIHAMNTFIKAGFCLLKKVYQSGVKKLYRVTTETKRQVITTLDHRFYTIYGWLPLEELSAHKFFVYIHLSELHGRAKQIALDRIVSIEYYGEEMTYDVSVPHVENFIGSDFVLHNSGKCLMPGTRILRPDYSTSLVDELEPRDLLLAPSGKSTEISQITEGIGDLFWIKPEVGVGFGCNADHILSLKHKNGQFTDIELKYFLELSPITRKKYYLYKMDKGEFIDTLKFSIKYLGKGRYIGFSLKHEKHFLLNDFTVSHNTEIAALITKHLHMPTLFVVPGKELLSQTIERFAKRIEIPIKQIGAIGDKSYKIGEWITVGTMQSLNRKLKDPDFYDYLQEVKVIFGDECHKTPAGTYYEVMMNCPAPFRIAMSGTPLNRTDGQDFKLLAATGPVIFEMRNKELIERGISNGAEVWVIRILEPQLHRRVYFADAYKAGIVDNGYRNNAVKLLTEYFATLGKSVVIFVQEIAHGQNLLELIKESAIPEVNQGVFIHGSELMEVRKAALQDFKDEKLRVIISTKIISEGVDIPNIDVIIRAEGYESSIKTLQTIGRGLRKGGTSDTLIIVDFIDLGQYYLTKHSFHRFEDYRNEDCFIVRDKTSWFDEWRTHYEVSRSNGNLSGAEEDIGNDFEES